MSTIVPTEDDSASHRRGLPDRALLSLLDDLPAFDETVVVYSGAGTLTLGQLRAAVASVAAELARSGAGPGRPVGALVGSGTSGIVAMFATWSVGAVYLPINRRSTDREVATIIGETPVDVLLGSAADLDRQRVDVGLVEFDEAAWTAHMRRAARGSAPVYDHDIALILRTSGTTGRPKAVQLRHGSTLDALDSSLRKLRRRAPGPRTPHATIRVNLIPVSLALWSGIFNTLFSLRAGFGVVLLDRFSPAALADAVRTHAIKSTVLAPAMITMLCDSEDIGSLHPLEIVRSITAPLSPATARRFHNRFGALVLNSYGQTELGGEVVGWSIDDIRRFGPTKLGAAGRPYDDVDVRIVDDSGRVLAPDELGQILIRSPFRMRGYATVDGSDDDRVIDGFLRTGDIGRLDLDGFLWIEGRVSDMINRGGLKVFPDEVEEVLRRHPSVRDAAVAGVPDSRLGEVPYAWAVPVMDGIDPAALDSWCREHLAPYKVPAAFIEVDSLPRSDIGKVLRRELRATVTPR
jgi:acyl-CoA synthetase (AMP-forming)/AMP-acid ligase II